MSGVVLEAVQQALYTKLTGDSLLMDLVTGVYDAVPQQVVVPYVVIGDGSAEEMPQVQTAISTCTMVLHVWTGGGGRRMALSILNRLHGLLHHGALSMSGMTLLASRCTRAETQVDTDTDRVYGVLELSLTVRVD